MNRASVDWGVLNDPTVVEIAEQVAASAASKNVGILERDDLTQEAMTLVASKWQLRKLAESEDYGLLHRALGQDLYDKFIRPLLRSGQMDAMRYKSAPLDPEREGELYGPAMVFDTGTGDYTPDAVALLLPAVWDESYTYGLPSRDDAPDQDMPRATSNKARANNLAAYIADIKAGWKHTPLTVKERTALLLILGMGWTQEQVAHNQMVSQPMISKRVDRALQKIAARLNGGTWELDDETQN